MQEKWCNLREACLQERERVCERGTERALFRKSPGLLSPSSTPRKDAARPHGGKLGLGEAESPGNQQKPENLEHAGLVADFPVRVKEKAWTEPGLGITKIFEI